MNGQHDPVEKARLDALFDASVQHADSMGRDAHNASIEIAKEKTQYFEKNRLGMWCNDRVDGVFRRFASRKVAAAVIIAQRSRHLSVGDDLLDASKLEIPLLHAGLPYGAKA